MEKGKFIVFEGIDGSGKSTQIKLLSKYLASKQIPCYVTREPSDGPIGALVRQCLSGRIETDEKAISALFAADRLDHLYNKTNGLIEKINGGTTVLCDRYYLSSYAYHGSFMPMERVIQLNKMAAEALKPDVNIFIDVDPEASMERIGRRGETDRYEKLESLRSIRNSYFKAFELLKDSESIAIVKSMSEIKETEKLIKNIVDGIFNFNN